MFGTTDALNLGLDTYREVPVVVQELHPRESVETP